VEQFEQIRREYEHGVGTIKGVARKLGVHRRMVREAIGNASPKARKVGEREKPKLAGVMPWIEEILQADQKAPRKQRHTAHRIWCRLKRERPEMTVAESTVRQYVRKRKIELGLKRGEVFIPQTYRWGQEGQVDWYEASAEIDGEQEKIYVFCLRSMASGGAFHWAYPHASQQAFLEAHERAFEYFGGVFEGLRYDNLTSAVKRILRGSQREENERFIAFRSHWGFQSEFCTPGQGHEKGGVEGENGYYRRNHLGAATEGAELGGAERVAAGGMQTGRESDYWGAQPERGCGDVHGTGTPSAAGGRRFRVGVDPLSEGEHERVRESADQLLFDASARGLRGTSQSLRG
jgi:transposase